MTRDTYPLVWWVKKHHPHRHGQRCRRTDSRYGEVALGPLTPEPWEASDPTWRLFQFEDGTHEWGPKHCARRPARDWQDSLEHRTPECTGSWYKTRGGITCDGCAVWVRKTEDILREFRDTQRAELGIEQVVQTNHWRAVIQAAQEGVEPLEFARLLVTASRGIEFDESFCDAAEEFDVLVGRRARRATP